MCFPLQQANIKELQEQRIDRQWRSGLLCVRLLVQATKRKLKPYCIPGCPISMYILTRDALVHTATPYIKTYKAFLLASSGMQIIGTDTAKYYLVVWTYHLRKAFLLFIHSWLCYYVDDRMAGVSLCRKKKFAQWTTLTLFDQLQRDLLLWQTSWQSVKLMCLVYFSCGLVHILPGYQIQNAVVSVKWLSWMCCW